MHVLVRVLIALAMGLAIYRLGMGALRSASSPVARRGAGDLKDPGGGSTYLVCEGCGTEFRVTKVGEGQVPRHCGEKMRVEHRPS